MNQEPWIITEIIDGPRARTIEKADESLLVYWEVEFYCERGGKREATARWSSDPAALKRYVVGAELKDLDEDETYGLDSGV
ncbi:hypothetical protein [Deinococcus cellulosilyticus]|uniref:Uncharacterized protein n=1 Tax=Deinococcus cellulosilyticus (strain DSM 18568 / NBRC 106333 / KACC 11606 / 5516J-15) TaxID=1223518 RepID=A0A511NAU4_DEIC1|nr:hypothetical protein [Deinococcus cellulosilyticus]GEM49628.1 hypothetical protein DC3_52630 [Deinococcus cellulosilyticus NBRC 106333 = KACC 11606]